MVKDQENYEAMFNEGAALDAGEVTEDMAAGLDLNEAVEEQSEPPETAQAEMAESEMESTTATDKSPTDMEAAPVAEASPSEDMSAPDSEATELEKERQRLKSWEGRLKALDAQLKAKEQAGMTDGTESPEVAAATAAMETQPIDEVMATLAEDFGDDFVSALSQVIEARAAEIASKVADEKVGAVAGNVDQLISSLSDEKARNHFEAIAEAHPDFMDVAQSDAFKQWVGSLGDKAEQAQAIINNGSTRQVIKLLSDFKAAAGAEPQEPTDDAAMMAAQSVPSRGGMRLPEKPQVADDYESAWKSFT